jgi:hypothetical protein
MKVHILKIEYKKTLFVSLALLGCIVASYLFFVSSSVFNTVALKDAEIKNAETRSTLAGLEARYVSIEKTIDKERVSELGFSDAETNLFSYNSFSSSVSSR